MVLGLGKVESMQQVELFVVLLRFVALITFMKAI